MTTRPDDEALDDELFDEELRRRTTVRRVVQLVVVIALVAAGVAGGVIWGERRAVKSAHAPSSGAPTGARESKAIRSQESTSAPGVPAMPPAQAESPSGPPATGEPVEVTLTPEAVQRAGIKTAVARSESSSVTITVPGTVTSNAYRETKVNSLVGGIVRQVSAELGASVSRGQPLAVIFSNELADAQMKYLSMQAMLHADHQKLQRSQKLVEIGAASRQELEEVTAVHAAHVTELAAYRQRLLLLGLSSDQVTSLRDAAHIVSELSVPAPANGVVIARAVNPGQVVGAAQELFVVADLSTVWIIGDLYEKDFASVRVGSEASAVVPSAPQNALRGRVAYIDPRVDPATRTAKVRVEVPNRDGELRLGMYVTLSFRTSAGERLTVVPRSAVQSVGERAVVYVAAEGEDGRFTERTVKLGSGVGDSIQVLDGVKPGEKVVTEGSFFLRAEAARARAGG